MHTPERILITGAAGFIGSNLTHALLARGHTIVGYDNLAMGSLLNLEQSLGHPRFEFVEADVLNQSALLEAARGCQVIVHLAAFKIPRYGGRLETLRVNEAGGTSVLEAARQVGARVVWASTSDVYGRSPELPFKEDGPTLLGCSKSARWSYAVSKLFDEHLAFAYSETHQVKSTIIRIFGSYGPNQHLTWWGGPQSVFIGAVLKDEAIEIHGDGLQTRSFCYISDLVRGWVTAIERVPESCEIFNLGNAQEVTILYLAELIKRLSNTPGELKLRFKPYESFDHSYEDVRRRVPDLSKARQHLGYEARVPLEEGLARTLVWQEKRMRDSGLFDLAGASMRAAPL